MKLAIVVSKTTVPENYEKELILIVFKLTESYLYHIPINITKFSLF